MQQIQVKWLKIPKEARTNKIKNIALMKLDMNDYIFDQLRLIRKIYSFKFVEI